jgi:ATP-dependent transcriptional regulator
MQGRDDVAGFIAGFAGDDRYVVDYLAEEVLQRQPDRVQAFLLQTSILGRLSGPLCDAVTGQGGGKACWRRWTGGTCSWSRWMTAAGGIATTICLRRAAGAPAR